MNGGHEVERVLAAISETGKVFSAQLADLARRQGEQDTALAVVHKDLQRIIQTIEGNGRGPLSERLGMAEYEIDELQARERERLGEARWLRRTIIGSLLGMLLNSGLLVWILTKGTGG